ncbi:putative methyltransferase [Halotydeus destructor]|nr:putative methyltransferase [Halotydeus destructor]
MSYRLFEGAKHASIYSKFRPQPPSSLIQSLIQYVRSGKSSTKLQVAVDTGCGTGQCTSLLSPHFEQVYGFDVSPEQVNQAVALNVHPNVQYSVSPAEVVPLPDGHVDLITSCQAFHWYDQDKFFREANRALKKNGVLALLTYKVPWVYLPDSEDKMAGLHDLIKKAYEHNHIKHHWAAVERQLVDSGYATVTVPFQDVRREEHVTSSSAVGASDILGYVKSWSAYHTCLKKEPEKAAEFEDNVKTSIEAVSSQCSTDQFRTKFDYTLIMGRK